jgi:predicted RNase H-like HicB family nuclease
VRLHAVAFIEDGEWIAHCLQTDTVSSGPTAQAAIDALTEALALQLEHAGSTDNVSYLFRITPLSVWQKLATIMHQPHQVVVRSIDGGSLEIYLEGEPEHDADV